jgi:hypothetical protein
MEEVLALAPHHEDARGGNPGLGGGGDFRRRWSAGHCWLVDLNPVPTVSQGDIVVSENLAIWQAMAVFYVITL